MTSPILTLRNLEFCWPDNPEFTLKVRELILEPRATLFIHGPSGCGKSTLLNLMVGILQPPQGTIELLGEDLTTLPHNLRDSFRGHHTGFIFQQFNLILIS